MISAMIGNIDDVDSFMESDLTKVSTSELTDPHEYNILSEDCHGHDGDDDSCGGNDDDDDNHAFLSLISQRKYMVGPSATLNPGKRTVMTILAKAMMMTILLIKRELLGSHEYKISG